MVLLQFIAIFSVFLRGSFKYYSFEVMVLHIPLSREARVNDKSPVMFVLATVYRPPGHQGTIQTLLKNLLIFYQS